MDPNANFAPKKKLLIIGTVEPNNLPERSVKNMIWLSLPILIGSPGGLLLIISQELAVVVLVSLMGRVGKK